MYGKAHKDTVACVEILPGVSTELLSIKLNIRAGCMYFAIH